MPAASPDPPSKPPVIAELVLTGHHRYRARTGDVELILDGASRDGPNPVQALVLSLAGCMAMDVEEMLRRGHHPLDGLRARIVAERRPVLPTHLTRVALHLVVAGDVPAAAVERALGLSRETYCTVWHSLRPDLELVTTYEIRPADG